MDLLTITYTNQSQEHTVVITEVHAWMGFSAISWIVFLLVLFNMSRNKVQ